MPQIKLIQNKLKDTGIKNITYIGGEPFLREGLLEISSHARSLNIKTAVVTNGSLITESMATAIAANDIFNNMIFSIDGPEPIHDAIRGKSQTFASSARSINLLQKTKKVQGFKTPKIYIYATISSLNYKHILSVYDIAKKLDVNALRFTSVSCITNSIINETNALLRETALEEHSYNISESTLIPCEYMPEVKNQLSIVDRLCAESGKKLFVEKYLLGEKNSNCAFIEKNFVISPYGDVFLCPMLPRYTIGNVLREPLEIILSRTTAKNRMKLLANLISTRKLPVCPQCCVEKII